MDIEEHKIKKDLGQSVSKTLNHVSDEPLRWAGIKAADILEINKNQKTIKQGTVKTIDIDQDLSTSSSSSDDDDDDDEELDSKIESESYINSDEYMSNVSEEECAVFMCNECGKKFNNGVSLKAHLAKKHNPRALVSCELCDSKYRGDFTEHLDSDHTSISGGYFCKKCEFICADYETILKHHHDKDVVNVCKECGKMYKSKENYKLHMLVHSNGGCKKRKEKFSCETCGKNFLFTCLVKDDINLNRGMKKYYPWKCQVCRCASSQKAAMKQHSSVNSSGRSYKCPECNRAFNRNGDLKKHLRSHAGERPFI